MNCSECKESGEFICECRRRFCQMHMNNHLQISEHTYCSYITEIDDFLEKYSEVKKKLIADSAKFIRYFENLASDLIKVLDHLKKEVFKQVPIEQKRNMIKNFKGANFPSGQLDNIQTDINKVLINDYVGKITSIVPPKYDDVEEIKVFYETQGLFLEGHTNRVFALTVSSNNEFLVSCSYDQTIKIWDLKLKNQKATLRGHTSNVLTLALTKDDNYLVSGGRDSLIIKWNIRTKEKLQAKQVHNSYVFTVAVTTDNKFIVSGSANTIAISNFDDLNLVKMLSEHDNIVNSLVITSDNKFIISGGNDKSVIIWNFNIQKMKRRLEGHTDSVIGVALMSDDKFIVSKSLDKTIKLWNLRTEKLVKTFEGDDNLCKLYVPIGKSIILREQNKNIIKYNTSKDSNSSFNTELAKKSSSIVATNDNKSIIAGGEDGIISIFCFKKPHYKAILPGHTSLVTAIEVTTDYRFLLSASGDMTVRVWNVESRSQETIFKGHKSGILSLAITSDNNFVASGGTDGSIIIWNLNTRMKETDLQGHDSRVIALAIVYGNLFLVSGSDNQKVIIWNLHTYAIEKIYDNEYDAINWKVRIPEAANVIKKTFPNLI